MPIEYKGFKLMVTVERQSADDLAARWRGHFGFWSEDGAFSREGMVSRTEASPDDARTKTLRIAKSIIDAEWTGADLSDGRARTVFLHH